VIKWRTDSVLQPFKQAVHCGGEWFLIQETILKCLDNLKAI